MAALDNSNNNLVRLMEDGYIRSHIGEIESMPITSGIYFTMYGDNKKINEKTNKKIDLKENNIQKQYKNLRLFIFNTNSISESLKFDVESSDYKRIGGKISFTYRIDNRKITSAEKVEFKGTKNDKSFSKNDFLNIVSPIFQDSIRNHIKRYEASKISKESESVCHEFDVHRFEWCSEHGFVLSDVSVNISYNQHDEEQRDRIEKDKEEEQESQEIRKLERRLTKERLKTDINSQEAKNEIDKNSGESVYIIRYKELYSRAVENGVMNTKRLESPDDYDLLTDGDKCSICCFKNNVADVIFPSTVEINGRTLDVTDIGPVVFEKKAERVTDIIVEEGILQIDGKAFRGCKNLESITLPDSLVSIGAFSFTGCNKLKKIVIPDNVKRIDSEAFSGCLLKEIEIPDKLDISNLVLPHMTKRTYRSSKG